MNCMSLYGGFYAPYDAEVLRTRKAYGLYKLEFFLLVPPLLPQKKELDVGVLFYSRCVLLCFVRNCFKTIIASPPTQACREEDPPSHPMKCTSLYGGYHVSYDAEVQRTRKAYGLHQL